MKEKAEISPGIAERLKEFAVKKFGNVEKLADQMEMSGHSLRQFTRKNSGKLLGGFYLYKLAELGCDINWLLTGRGHEPVNLKKELERELENIKNNL